MAVRAARLPGIRFEVQPPPLAQSLPRMDIGVFVGFAASGPLNIPVAVQDMAQFEAVFGGELPLAWDEQRGALETAYLAGSVRAFFRNGGKRCYIIRTAGPALGNIFPLPGLLGERSDGQLCPAYVQARSAGSWSDDLQAGWDLLSQPLGLASLTRGESFQAEVTLAKPDDLLPGDLLLASFQLPAGGESYQLMFTPETLTPAGPGGLKYRVRWTGGRWFRLPGLPAAGAGGQARARIYNSPAFLASRQPNPSAWIRQPDNWRAGQPVQLALDLPLELAPQPGSLVQADFSGERLWLTVLSAQVKEDETTGKAILEITGSGLWESDPPPGWVENADNLGLARLRMRLRASRINQPERNANSLGELGFLPGQPRYWGGLPTDQALYAASQAQADQKLWQAAAAPRFPLAGLTGPGSVLPASRNFFPLPLPAAARLSAGAIRRPGTPLERDGLGSFSVDLFLDPLLQECSVDTLASQANFLAYEIARPHQPAGIYAALNLEEATLIAVPDALHTGWQRDPAPAFTPIQQVVESVPPAPCCPPLPEEKLGQFSTQNLLGSPILSISEAPGVSARVSWTPVSGNSVTYRLQEASLPDFSDAVTVFNGDGLSYNLAGRGAGIYSFRVRAEQANPPLTGVWSPASAIRIGQVRRWKTLPPAGPDDASLIRFHAALLTLCASRGDLFAVLGLPLSFHEDEALCHAQKLQAQQSGEAVSGFLSDRTLSFGAVYHPWLFSQSSSGSDLLPPQGALCGTFARRSLGRGAWLAPANEPLNGVVALQPRISPARFLDLQEGAINLVRQEPGGFITLSEQTLTLAGDYRPVHVRRLMSLLRRLALRDGAAYVFEPNSPAFRHQVQRGLEEILEDLFSRGAFGGPTPETSFQVEVSDRLNPPASLEQGRLVVEIRVAPAQALAFLTVRLLQTGAGQFQVQEGSS